MVLLAHNTNNEPHRVVRVPQRVSLKKKRGFLDREECLTQKSWIQLSATQRLPLLFTSCACGLRALPKGQ